MSGCDGLGARTRRRAEQALAYLEGLPPATPVLAGAIVASDLAGILHAMVQGCANEVAYVRAVVAAMREAVLEFEQQPPAGQFVSIKDGAIYATAPDVVCGYFAALDERWRSPEVARWSEEFRSARDRAAALANDLEIARAELAVLRSAKAGM